MTTFTTVTTCPVTTTVTKSGSTYVDTILTTSTVVVSKCPGGSCGSEVTVTKPDVTVGTTTKVEITYTTTCPVTTTTTVSGSTYTHVYTTTFVEVTQVVTTILATKTLPPITKTSDEVVFLTETHLWPHTETKTIAGSAVIVTWTSTSTVITQVPVTKTKTKTEHTSYTVTSHVQTSIFETVTCPVTTYTTVSNGVTVCVTSTDTLTKYLTAEITVTDLVPVTRTTEVDVTVTSHVTSTDQTVTALYPTVWVTYSETETNVVTYPGPGSGFPGYPTTTFVITTTSAGYPSDGGGGGGGGGSGGPTTTTPSIPVQALATQVSPAAALLFGVAGVAALL
ncbi:hypothetical protein F4777DRAFT_555136 [Nemania sp. FL0916]|nr:hypothetical protein F4777DRAFT_555136 [Nemania sp. FL0916]